MVRRSAKRPRFRVAPSAKRQRRAERRKAAGSQPRGTGWPSLQRFGTDRMDYRRHTSCPKPGMKKAVSPSTSEATPSKTFFPASSLCATHLAAQDVAGGVKLGMLRHVDRIVERETTLPAGPDLPLAIADANRRHRAVRRHFLPQYGSSPNSILVIVSERLSDADLCVSAEHAGSGLPSHARVLLAPSSADSRKRRSKSDAPGSGDRRIGKRRDRRPGPTDRRS